MHRALTSKRCWSYIKQNGGSWSSSGSSSTSILIQPKRTTTRNSTTSRHLHSSRSVRSSDDSLQSSVSASNDKGKAREVEESPRSDPEDQLPKSQPHSDSTAASSAWELFNSEAFFTDRDHDAGSPAQPESRSRSPLRTPSSVYSPPSTRVSREVLFSPGSSSSSALDPNLYHRSDSNQAARAEIMRRRSNERHRLRSAPIDDVRTSPGSDNRRASHMRPPMTEPEKRSFEKVFELISGQETVEGRSKLNDEIGNAIGLVEELKGKGDGKLGQDFRNSSRFIKRDGGELIKLERDAMEKGMRNRRFREYDDQEFNRPKSIHETFEEILRTVSIDGLKPRRKIKSEDTEEPRAGREDLATFMSRNRLNRFRNQVLRRPREADVDGEDQTVMAEDHLKDSKDDDMQKKLMEVKEEIDALKDLTQVWTWFSSKVLRTTSDKINQKRYPIASEPDHLSNALPTPYGPSTPFYSPVLMHLFQTFKTRFDSPESSITLYKLVKNHSVESLIMSSTVSFFDLVLKTYWLDFRDYRECLKVLEVAKMVGVLDQGEDGDDPAERDDEADSSDRSEDQNKFGDESIRETVELIRNEIRQDVLAKIELKKGKSNTKQSSIPFDMASSFSGGPNLADPDQFSVLGSDWWSIPVSVAESIKSEFNDTSLEAAEKLKIVDQMAQIVGKPFRVSSRITKDVQKQTESRNLSQDTLKPRAKTFRPKYKDEELSRFDLNFKRQLKTNTDQSKKEILDQKKRIRLARLRDRFGDDSQFDWSEFYFEGRRLLRPPSKPLRESRSDPRSKSEDAAWGDQEPDWGLDKSPITSGTRRSPKNFDKENDPLLDGGRWS